MSGEEDLYLNQSEAEALFFSDALLGNADELDFESFGDASGLDDGTFNGITGPGLITFEARDIFKSTLLNGDSFVDEVEAKCDPSLTVQQEVAGNGGPYSNGNTHSNYVFNKPTLDPENMGMAYGISGLYLQGNGKGGLGSPSSPSMSMSQTGLMSPSMTASEKMNGLTLGQTSYCPPTSYSTTMAYPSARASSVNAGTTQFISTPPTVPVAQVVTSQPLATKGMSRFGSQEVLMAAAENGGLSTMKESSTSPVTLSPSSSDGQEQVERLIAGENGMKMSQEKQYYGLQQQGILRQDSGVDTTDFGDQVDGDGDGLQPLPQMTRSSMQRSYSSHALGQLRHMGPAPPSSENAMNARHSQMDRSGGLTGPGTRLPPTVAEFQNVVMRPMSAGMRRVYSAGDIQTLNGMQGSFGGSASPSFDDGNYRVGKYSMEERKIRIHRYQQKRTQRNFNKKIKYACRKTLADSRPRVRGRFAKNMDDDMPVAVLGRKREDDDDEEGDAHVGGRANGTFHSYNSSGEYSDVLTSIKVEHQRVNSM